jgi:formylglycine-generating enzyme required for sulfatase activity
MIALLLPMSVGGTYSFIYERYNRDTTIIQTQKINIVESIQRQEQIIPNMFVPSPQLCPLEMVEVSGEHCETVLHVCKKWISRTKDRCAEYYRTVKCFGKTTKMHYCIDKYEAGNNAGDYVPRDATYWSAKKMCEQKGKRLPTIQEWELACEGPERTPYPYGFVRDATTCNIDRNYIMPNNDLWYKDRQAEIDRLDQSEPSGSRPGCCSAYGVCDLTGNLDEWTYDSTGFDNGGNGKEAHYKSALKGGAWLTNRNRCRPITATHNPEHHWYQTSWRCVKDIL